MTNEQKLTAALETAVKDIQGARDALQTILDQAQGGA
jgi:hypothetical protein